MTDLAIRRIADDEALDVLYRHASYAFHPSPPLTDRENWMGVVRNRTDATYVGLFEDGKALAVVCSSPMTQNVRGVGYSMAGVWGVATAPAARRKGYSRMLLTRLLGEARDAGHTVSTLYPFRESFYERLGYVTFPVVRRYTFHPSALAPLLRRQLPGTASMRQLSEGLDEFDAYVVAHRSRIHGMATFDQPDPSAATRFPAWLVLAQVEGETVGLMTYRFVGEGPVGFNMIVGRFYYHTPAGRYLLLEWIARHVDQAEEVEIWLPPFEQPETWFPDLQVRIAAAPRAPMGRVLDVGALGGMEVGGPGRVAFRLRDPYCPAQEGCWVFSAQDGRLAVQLAPDAALELQVQALSALVYGTHDPADFSLRGWGTPDSVTQDAMRTLFPSRQPYLHLAF